MGQILLLSLVAAADPVLAGATALMLLLPSPKKLMLGFIVGAFLTSIPVGLVIVFALQGTKGPVSTTKHTVNPALNITLGCGVLVISIMLATGIWDRLKERRKKRAGPPKDKGPSRMQQALSKGSPKLTFGVGAVYEAMPSVVFLAAMHEIVTLNVRTVPTVLLVVVVCAAQLTLVLVPLISFAIAPDWTPRALERAKAWLGREARTVAVVATAIIGAWLLVRGVIPLFN